jgi:hypothetical protein
LLFSEIFKSTVEDPLAQKRLRTESEEDC